MPKTGPPLSTPTICESRLPLESAWLLAIIEDAADAIISISVEGGVITWNSGAARLFGYTAAEMIGGPLSRLLPAARAHEAAELIAQLAQGRNIPHFVTQRLRKNGSPIDVSVALSPVRDAHGHIVAVSEIAREITRPQQRYLPHDASTLGAAKLVVRQPTAHSNRAFGPGNDGRDHANRALSAKIDELVRNEQRFETLVRLTSQVIWTSTPDGGIEGSQPGWSAFTGQSFDDYQGVGWSAAVHRDDPQPTMDEWPRCVADRRPMLFEHRLRRHDGAYRTCTINAAPILNNDGTIREWIGVHNDITERREQEAKFRVLTEAMPQFVWTCRPDGWMEYLNQRCLDYTGLTLGQSQGWGWGSAVHADDVQHCVRIWNDALQSGKAYEVEFRLLRAADGMYRWHLGRGVPLLDAQGGIAKWLGTATDIEDYKAAEARNLAFQAELEDRVRQRTAELQRVGKIAGVGGWSISVARDSVQWSDETCRIHDLEPGHRPTFDEAVGYYTEASRSVIETACRNCIANATPFDLELQVTTAKGRGIWVRAVGEAQMEHGTVARVFGAFQDITVRKLAERELFDQHELLRVTLESIGDAVITTDVQGNVQSLNSVAAQLTGWTASESRGLPVERVFDIKDARARQRMVESMGRAPSNDISAATGMDAVLIARDGAEVSIEDSVAPIRDKMGQVVGSVVVFRDVSERQRVAQALRKANERFTLAADASGIGVWEWDLSSNSLCWDDQMYRLYGRTRATAEEPYALWSTSLHPEDRGRAEWRTNEGVRDGSTLDNEYRIVLPSGEIRHLKAQAQFQYDAAGAATRMIGISFDITTLKQAALDLKQTSSLLRMVLNSANDLAIIATTPDLTIRVFNTGAERLTGYARAELIDRATPAVFHDAGEIEARGLELSTLLGRSVHGAGVFHEPTTLDVPREWTYIRKDRRRVPVVLTISAMFDESGSLSGYIGVARDITRDREHDRSLQDAKSAAERANAAKSEFLANMSHEIRTPLNAIIGLGYVLEHTPLSEEQRSSLREINFAGRSLLSVINNVLDISKIEAGQMLLEDAEFDLKHLIQNVGQMLSPSAEAKGLVLSVRCAADLPSQVRGDATRLGQIATNLLNNAIKFTETGRVEVILSCSTPTVAGVSVRLAVRDTGIGIGTQGLARLFKPFSQADTSTTRRFGGTGLGLSIARRFVELMGGEIGVTSTVGIGSEFWAEIPLRVADAGIRRALQPTPTNPGDTQPLAGVRILVVDDNPVNLKVAQHILKRHGAAVTTRGTGAEALERLRLAPDGYDLVLMDVQMPVMDGNEATQRIRTDLQLTALPIVALTAGALASEREQSLRAGMNDFLTKPFDPDSLIAVVQRHMKQKPVASLPTGITGQAVGTVITRP